MEEAAVQAWTGKGMERLDFQVSSLHKNHLGLLT